MDILQHFQNWVKGEISQARFMIGIGLILFLFLIFIYRNDNEVLNGLKIPLCLIVITLIGYGTFILKDRSSRLSKIQAEYSQTSSFSIEEEKGKIADGIESCKTTIKIWYAIIVLGIMLSLLVNAPYYRGVAIGVLLVGISFLLIDLFIDQRAKEIYSTFI